MGGDRWKAREYDVRTRFIELAGKINTAMPEYVVPRLGRFRKYTFDLALVPLTAEALRGVQAAVIVTDHSAVDYALVVRHVPLVVDTRNATREVLDSCSA